MATVPEGFSESLAASLLETANGYLQEKVCPPGKRHGISAQPDLDARNLCTELDTVFVNALDAVPERASFDPSVLMQLVKPQDKEAGRGIDNWNDNSFFSLREGYKELPDNQYIDVYKGSLGKQEMFKIFAFGSFPTDDDEYPDEYGLSTKYTNKQLPVVKAAVQGILDKIPEAVAITKMIQLREPDFLNATGDMRKEQWVRQLQTKVVEAKLALEAIKVVNKIEAEGNKANKMPTNQATEYVSLFGEDQGHLERHFAQSLVAGSKFHPEAKDAVMQRVEKELKAAFEAQIAKGENPSRVVLTLNFDKPVGTDALVSLKGQSEDSQHRLVRDAGTPGEAAFTAVQAEKGEIPQTNVVTAIGGPYGPTGKWGIYTMFPGKEAPPFPSDRQPDEAWVKNAKFWREHGFLATREEIASHPKAQGAAVSAKPFVAKGGKYAVLNVQNPQKTAEMKPAFKARRAAKQRGKASRLGPKL
ncbi:MAG: hypothetical protein PHE27_03835 [Alphaproteobacteria bacterium]|nr:hypothetical protein [Alphaproteobacteria bacterium]